MSIKDTLSQAAAIRDAVGQTVGKTVGTVAKDQMNHVVSTVLKQRSYKVLHAADASSRVAEQANRDLLFRLLEDNKDTVTPSNVVTNFYIMYGQDVSLTDNASEFGHGYDRYETILDILCREDGEYRLETVWDCLREASQLPNPDDITSNTQWSVVYDHVNRTADVVQRRQWEETHHFAIGSQ